MHFIIFETNTLIHLNIFSFYVIFFVNVQYNKCEVTIQYLSFNVATTLLPTVYIRFFGFFFLLFILILLLIIIYVNSTCGPMSREKIC